MAQPNLRVIDPNREHPRDAARKAVKRFRTLVEQERLPISNQICTGAPSLRVDEVLKRSEPDHIGKK